MGAKKIERWIYKKRDWLREREIDKSMHVILGLENCAMTDRDIEPSPSLSYAHIDVFILICLYLKQKHP
jgi:hypothetical protein